jgi:hypothetical protein
VAEAPADAGPELIRMRGELEVAQAVAAQRAGEVQRLTAQVHTLAVVRDEEVGRLREEVSLARAERETYAGEAMGGTGGDPEALTRLEDELAAARTARDSAAMELDSAVAEMATLRAALADRDAEIQRIREEASARIAEVTAAGNGDATREQASVAPPGSSARATSRPSRFSRGGSDVGERVVATILILLPVALAVLLLTGVLKLSFGS